MDAKQPTAAGATWHVAQCPLLKHLRPEELAEVAKLANVVSYGSKRVISIDDPSARYVWIVKRGHLKMDFTGEEGVRAAVVPGRHR
ncbi:MAG: hypothetical protein SF028_01385 [Candidatus Sumerlaeia bacterium]|nr:hypothetical protein [Candidatus Sumerlaeia bacterium]